jgi:hypothetical protein
MGVDNSGNTGSGKGSANLGVNGAEGHVSIPRPSEIHVNQTSSAPGTVTTGFNPKNLGNYPKGSDRST